VADIEYDIECRVRFGTMIEEPKRKAFKSTVEGTRAAWYGPRPVVAWMGPEEAAVYLVVRASDDQATAAPALVKDAESQVRGWVDEAGLAGSSPDGFTLECQASARA
jgi:hypothetical protein